MVLLSYSVGQDSWEFLGVPEIKPVNPRGNQSWIFIGRTDAEAPILWPPDAKSQLIGKDPDTGKDWGREEKVATEDEVIRWHHRLNGHEFEQTLGDSEGQGSLMCCSPWSQRVKHNLPTIQQQQQVAMEMVPSHVLGTCVPRPPPASRPQRASPEPQGSPLTHPAGGLGPPPRALPPALSPHQHCLPCWVAPGRVHIFMH